MGRIKSINISPTRGRKQPVEKEVLLKENYGIQGDYHAGSIERQISILDEADIREMRNHGLEIKSGDFGENIVCSDLDMESIELNSILKAGSEVELQVSKIGKECQAPCEIYYAVGDCIMPRKGLFCRVLHGGALMKGDTINGVF